MWSSYTVNQLGYNVEYFVYITYDYIDKIQYFEIVSFFKAIQSSRNSRCK